VTGVALAATVAALFAWPPRQDLRLRLSALVPAQPRVGAGAKPLFVFGASSVGVLMLGVAGWHLVIASVVMTALLAARRRARSKPEGTHVPLLADLLGACLAVGVATPQALCAAGDAVPAARDRCRRVAYALAAGVQPEDAWAEWLHDVDLAPIARACVRTARTGAATSAEIRRVAVRMRARRAADGAARAQRAGVLVVLPLGLCFLPAFVLVGIVPFALGLLAH